MQTPVSSALDSLEPINTSSTNEVIQEKLLKLIAAGQLQPGDKLPPQRILSDRLGISQVPLREALRSLEALGLIEARVGSGWYVKEYSFNHIAKALAPRLNVDANSVDDLDAIRTHLECAFLSEAVQLLTPEKLKQAEEALCEMERLHAEPDKMAEFIEHDRRFHKALFSGVSNRIFLELLDMFWILHAYLHAWIQTSSIERPTLAEQKRNFRVTARKHREFFTAISNGDVELARELRRKRLGPQSEDEQAE